jgi:hypothetical protein
MFSFGRDAGRSTGRERPKEVHSPRVDFHLGGGVSKGISSGTDNALSVRRRPCE